MKLRDCLDDFRNICDDLLQLAAEENALLRAESPVAESLLTRKRDLLASLTAALDLIRTRKKSDMDAERTAARELKGQVQQRMMQFLLLDRENEQLLLRSSMRPGPRPAAVRPEAAKVSRRYQQLSSK